MCERDNKSTKEWKTTQGPIPPMGLQWMARKNPHPEAGSSCLHLNLVLTMKTICIGHNSQTCQFMHKNENFSKVLLVWIYFHWYRAGGLVLISRTEILVQKGFTVYAFWKTCCIHIHVTSLVVAATGIIVMTNFCIFFRHFQYNVSKGMNKNKTVIQLLLILYL